MQEISLSQGKVTFVDDEDYEFLAQWKWSAHQKGKHWYAERSKSWRVDGKRYSVTIPMHRVITAAPKNLVVDHINHDGLDNRKENLRIVTVRENGQNKAGGRLDFEKLKHTTVKIIVYLDRELTYDYVRTVRAFLEGQGGVIAIDYETDKALLDKADKARLVTNI